MFKVNDKDTKTMPMAYFTPSSSVSIVNFEHVNADWINKAPLLILVAEDLLSSVKKPIISGLKYMTNSNVLTENFQMFR